MPLYVSYEKREYPQAPEGLHQAVCCDVMGYKTDAQSQYPDRDMVRITFQTEAADAEGKRYLVMRSFGRTLSPKGKLRPFLESWRGRKFTPVELAEFDLEALIGVNCQLQIVHELSTNGNEFANIQAVISIQRNTPKITVSPDFVRAKDRTDGGTPFVASEEDLPF
jgi:hypothetical protein